jgi:DNA-binding MarR family transcriptional regulator
MDQADLSEFNTYDVGLMQAQAYRALSAYMAQALEPFGLTMIEWAALGRICDSDGLRVSELAAMLSVEVPRAIFLINRLERKGYLARQPYAADKRVVLIGATATGHAQKAEIEANVKDRLRFFMLGVKPKDLAAYLKVVRFLAAKLYS